MSKMQLRMLLSSTPLSIFHLIPPSSFHSLFPIPFPSSFLSPFPSLSSPLSLLISSLLSLLYPYPFPPMFTPFLSSPLPSPPTPCSSTLPPPCSSLRLRQFHISSKFSPLRLRMSLGNSALCFFKLRANSIHWQFYIICLVILTPWQAGQAPFGHNITLLLPP